MKVINHEELKNVCKRFNIKCYDLLTINAFSIEWSSNSLKLEKAKIKQIGNKKLINLQIYEMK